MIDEENMKKVHDITHYDYKTYRTKVDDNEFVNGVVEDLLDEIESLKREIEELNEEYGELFREYNRNRF